MRTLYLILPLFFLCNISLFSQTNFSNINLFAEASIENNNHLIYADKDNTFRTNTSFNIGSEVTFFKYESPIKYGVGVLFQFPSSIIGQDGDYSFIPLYALTRINVFESDFFITTLQVRLGYNFLLVNNNYLGGNGDFNGGLYYSIGSVLTMDNEMQIRLFYSVNYGKYKTAFSDYLVKNNQFTIGLGYGFNL